MSAGVAGPLQQAELGRLLQEADAGAVLISPRLVRRVIKSERRIPGLGLQVPHRKCYVIRRDALLEIATLAELEIDPDRDLPESLLLLARPDEDKLALMPRDRGLLKFWRLLFHAKVDQALAARLAGGKLTEAGIRDRINRIGQTEFDEIRSVLRHENFLLPPLDNSTVYTEFAAVYLELSFFAAPLLPRYFPSLDDRPRIESVLAEDVDAFGLFQASRLAGAPDPTFPMETGLEDAGPIHRARATSRPADVQARALLRRAHKARHAGNLVRASLCAWQSGIAGDSESATAARVAAYSDLEQLARRLASALHFDDALAVEWRQILALLLEEAAHGHWPVEARLLYDLQKVCVDHERPIYSPDVIEWLYSHCKQPLVRPLPNQPFVRIVKHLRISLSRATSVRLPDVDRRKLIVLLRDALHHAEERLRACLRPHIQGAMADVGLQPATFVERIACDKLVEELLDRIAEHGLLSMGDLRDAISRNHLKLPDLAGPVELILGDPLIRLNRQLATALEGVYRRGEFYLRWLQRLSSVAFGTRPGRFLTRFLLLPFGAAFVALEGLQHLVDPLIHRVADTEVDVSEPWSVTGLGVFILLLIYLPPFRVAVKHGLQSLWRAVRGVCFDLPALLCRLPLMRRLVQSRAAAFCGHHFLKPALLVVPAWIAVHRMHWEPLSECLVVGGLFLFVSVGWNTRFGHNVEEAALDWLMRNWYLLHTNLLPGLFRWVLDTFRFLLETLDRALYSVDEWLRFRGGQSGLTLVFKVVLGFFWFLVTYVVRFCVNLLIEPQINPIKHFPVVTVSHKFLLPLAITTRRSVPSPLAALLLKVVPLSVEKANAVAATVVWGIPGIFGFLVWELKENWRLYAANRPRLLGPVLIGNHGESMARLLKLGFHSGTVPRLWARIRRAERRAHRTGDWRGVRKNRQALHHVEESVQHFVEREFTSLLNRSRSWDCGTVSVSDVELASNRIRLEVACAGQSGEPLEISFEEHSGWLLATISRPGWLPALSPEARAALGDALAGLYKKAGVELVREQIEASLGSGAATYDITDEGLVTWPDPHYETEVVYNLAQLGPLEPTIRGGKTEFEAATLDSQRLFFTRQTLSWQAWSEAWERDRLGQGHLPPLLADVRLLPPLSAPSRAAEGS